MTATQMPTPTQVIELFGVDNLVGVTKRELLTHSIAHRTKIILDENGNAQILLCLESTDYLTFKMFNK